MLTFAACGMEETEPEYGYLSDFVTVPEQVFKGVRYYATAEEGIYTAGENDPIIKRYIFETGETEKLFKLAGEERVLKIGTGKTDQERLLLLAVLRYGTNESGMTNWNEHSCFLRCYTVDGQLRWESAIEEDLSENTNAGLFMAEDGRVYMSTDTCFYVFSAEGQLLGRAEYEGESRKGYYANDVLACDGAGGAYVIQLTKSAVDIADKQYTVYCWEEDTRTLKEISRINGKEPVQLMEGDGFYFKDDTAVYRYDLQTEEMAFVFSLTDNLIDSNNVGRILQTENGWVIGGKDILLASDMQIITLEWGILPDRERFTLAAINAVTFNELVVSFNQQHPEYQLTIRKYESDNTPDGQDQILLSLLSKDAPDLVEIYSRENYLNYARKGYLLDLTSYVENSGYISREDYVSSVWEAMQVEDKIYGLPEQFYISTIAVPVSAVGDQSNWTIEEYLDFIEEHPNAYYQLIGGEMSLPDRAERKGQLLAVALVRGLEGFVDTSENKVELDNERFRSLLTRINGLQIDENAGLYADDLGKRISEGEILMCPATLGEVGAISQLEREHGQPMTLIGYPTAEREEGGGVLYVSSPLGISSKSEHMDAAWCFLEEIVLQESETDSGYFPANKIILEKLISTAQKTGNANFEGAFGGEGNADGNTLPQRHADMIWNAIASADVSDPVMRQLRLIIQEEASYYFAGEKTLDEVIELMENRADLYFQENS